MTYFIVVTVLRYTSPGHAEHSWDVKEDEQLRRARLAEKASSSNTRDLWTELRKINGTNK